MITIPILEKVPENPAPITLARPCIFVPSSNVLSTSGIPATSPKISDIHIIDINGCTPNFEIAIIDKNHETIPERFRQQSKGIILNFEVEDVDKIYERISEDKNMNILLEVQNEEWGQRHFIFEGPDNLLIDVIQIIEPTEEFLKQYK